MDVELQILKHLPRDPQATVSVIDQYCQGYKDIFSEVRSYEYFKYLHIGIIAPIKRKSFPEIAKVLGIKSPQSLHHFIANSPWSVSELRHRRLSRTVETLKGEKIIVVINETGDRKKGSKTDYVARQYLKNVGKIDRGIVSINTYGLYQNITFPLLCRVFKPEEALKQDDVYSSKIKIATEMIDELINYGFNIEWVWSDSLCDESSELVNQLEKYNLYYIASISKNPEVLMSSDQRIKTNQWHKLSPILSTQKSEECYIREMIFNLRGVRTYWEITTDTETLPDNRTSWVMTNIQEKTNQIKETIGYVHGLRTWLEYEFIQCQQELGWRDYRLTQFSQIEKWWELILSAYLMISLNSKPFLSLNSSESETQKDFEPNVDWFRDEQGNATSGWKNALNEFRLLIEPTLLF